MPPTLTVKQLLERVEPEPNTGCWLWLGSTVEDGYGSLSYRGKHWKAHRLFYTLFNGEIEDGLSVLHSCDTPACVNPSHLFLGTQDDNMKDAKRKGRIVYLSGEEHGSSRLTREQVQIIRCAYLHGDCTLKQLAAIFGVSFTHIHRIVKYQSWKEE